MSLVLFRAGAIDWSKRVLEEAPTESWESASLHVMQGRLHLLAADEHRDRTGEQDHILLLDATISFDSAIQCSICNAGLYANIVDGINPSCEECPQVRPCHRLVLLDDWRRTRGPHQQASPFAEAEGGKSALRFVSVGCLG